MKIQAYDAALVAFTPAMPGENEPPTFHFRRMTEADAEPFSLVVVDRDGAGIKYSDYVKIFVRHVERIDNLFFVQHGKEMPVADGAAFAALRDRLPMVKGLIVEVAGEIIRRSGLTPDEEKN